MTEVAGEGRFSGRPAAAPAGATAASPVELAEGGGLRGVRFWPAMGAAVRHGWRSAGTERRRRAGFCGWTLLGALVGAWILGVMQRRVPAAEWAAAVGVEAAWFLAFVFVGYVHLGLVRRPDGTPYRGFLVPNGLTLHRLTLCPLVFFAALHADALRAEADLVLWPLVYVVASDLLDGQIARFGGMRSEWGRLADPLADVCVATWFAAGLWIGGWLAPWLGFLIVFRFVGALSGVFLVWGRGGRLRVAPTWPGRAANVAVEFYFPALFAAAIRWPSWFAMGWLRHLHWVVGALVSASILYSFGLFLRSLRGERVAGG
ncbi:MAG: CDP-alcohol phosphatidyltransferase family protein [Myxococcales bacterium]|nr:CDP-alcohol phosphatidyltransferase family protein [Myxococcales bacterium]